MKRSAGTEVALLVSVLLCASGCLRGCSSSRPPIHPNPNMDWQPKLQAQEESEFFHDGKAMRPGVPGTVARGQYREDETFFTGKDAAGQFLAQSPVAEDERLLARGRERFGIYCQPCHDKKGTGKGILTERGGVPVPSFHEQRIVDLADGEIFDVMTNGKGLMPAYAYPVSAADRWAILAHVRWLQRETRARELAQAAPR